MSMAKEEEEKDKEKYVTMSIDPNAKKRTWTATGEGNITGYRKYDPHRIKSDEGPHHKRFRCAFAAIGRQSGRTFEAADDAALSLTEPCTRRHRDPRIVPNKRLLVVTASNPVKEDGRTAENAWTPHTTHCP